MKRLNKIARRITAFDKATEQFIKECRVNNKFTWNQMEVIRYGFENGLTMEQVKLYAKPEFNWNQMEVIREGFENHLTIEQVKVFAKPELNVNKMSNISVDLEEGMSIEEVKEKYDL